MENHPVIDHPWLRRRIIFRSFFIQNLWNYRSFLGAGFLYCIIPIMRYLYHSEEEQRAFLKRHSSFFNAHPYLATFALGVTMRIEEDIAAGDHEAFERLNRLKTLLISLLGARGDYLFWFSLKPSVLLAGAALVYFSTAAWQVALALVCIFLIYNIPHFYIRSSGLREGYQTCLEVYRCFSRNRFEKMRRIYLICGFLAYISLIIGVSGDYRELGLPWLAGFLLTVPLAAIVYRLTNNVYLVCMAGIMTNVLILWI